MNFATDSMTFRKNRDKEIYTMKKNFFLICLSISMVAVVAFSSVAFCQGIKERFKERLPRIIELKNQGVIGEDNKGYLDFVGASKEGADIVEAENRDRGLVYEKIAQEEKTAVEKVGKRRALQLRELAKPGDWLQDDSGGWYKK
jgi:uncharacterized protein